MDRRRFLQLTASSLAMSGSGIASSVAQAQWPTKNITMVVPFTPGGSTDILARLIGQRFTEAWGQGVVTENRPGAGGAVGSVALARAPADGYTVGMGHIGTLSVNPSLYSNLQYDPIKSFAHISMLARVYNVLVVHPSLPIKNVREFIDYARQNPGKLNYGSGGNGSAAHIATAAFMVATGTQMTHVPYRGTSPAVNDLLSGQIQFMMTGGPAVLPHARAGTMRALGVSGPNRLKSDPDIPTIAEAGVPGFDATPWYGMMAPAGTPQDIVAQLTKGGHGPLGSKATEGAPGRDGAEGWPASPQGVRDIIASGNHGSGRVRVEA